MKNAPDTALDDVLAHLQQGESPAACLARWPEYAEELRPLVETAEAGRQALAWVEPPSAAAMARLRRRYAAELDRHLARPWWQALWPGWGALRPVAGAVAVVLLVTAFAVGGVLSSARALPGEALYPVKRLAESARLLVTLDAGARARLETEFERRRIEEAQAVVVSGRQTTVRFRGRVEHMDGGEWTVAGLRLAVTEKTAIVGRPAVGGVVAVVARAWADGRLEATRIAAGTGPGGPAPSPTPRPTLRPSSTASATTEPGPAAPPAERPTGRPRATSHPSGTPHATPRPSNTPHATDAPRATPHATQAPSATPQGTPHATQAPHGTPQATDPAHGTPHATDAPQGTPHATDASHETPGTGGPGGPPHETGQPTEPPRGNH